MRRCLRLLVIYGVLFSLYCSESGTSSVSCPAKSSTLEPFRKGESSIILISYVLGSTSTTYTVNVDALPSALPLQGQDTRLVLLLNAQIQLLASRRLLVIRNNV